MSKKHANKCKTNDVNMISSGIVLSSECDCDGYHTFDELYNHRITLYIALCKMSTEIGYSEGLAPMAWRSKVHSDGSIYDGWFILGMNEEQGEQITYHIPISRWDETDFAETIEKAPRYDGHTSDDVLTRLGKL